MHGHHTLYALEFHIFRSQLIKDNHLARKKSSTKFIIKIGFKS